MNGLKKYFPPLHSLVKFHSGLTKRSPENYHFPSDVSMSWHPACEQPAGMFENLGPGHSSSCTSGRAGGSGSGSAAAGPEGGQGFVPAHPAQGRGSSTVDTRHRRGRDGPALEMAILVWVSALNLIILVRRTCSVGCAA